MPREIEITGIHLHANATPCFHHCRYCQLAKPKAIPARFDRYATLIDRFIDWRQANGRDDFEICPWYGNSHDHDQAVLRGIRRLDQRLGYSSNVVLLGGVAHRSPKDMAAWLQERRENGIDTVVATFSGQGGHHDYWNNKQGNYQFLLDTLGTAAAMGFHLQQRVLLIRDSVPSLDHLFDDLDAIDTAPVTRWAIPLFYSGRSKPLENQRLTTQDMDALPARIRSSLRDDHPNWRSERDWIQYVRDEDAQKPERMALSFPVSEESLDWTEDRSCDDILDHLETRWRAAYRLAPSRRDLCLSHGDSESDKVYMMIGHMEKRWFDRYTQDNPCAFDIQSTHFR
jgi:hypothetical protein